MRGVLLLLALLPVALLSVTRGLPELPRQPAATSSAWRPVVLSEEISLFAVFCYFLAQGVIWAYLFLIGLARGNTEAEVAAALSASQVFGLLGAGVAVAISDSVRYRR